MNKIKYEITSSREGVDTIAVVVDGKKIPLHSVFYPTKEARQLKELPDPDRYDIIIILGAGLGYHLVPFKNTAAKYKKIIIIDIIPDIENKIAENSITGFLTEEPNIAFIQGVSPGSLRNNLLSLIDFDAARGIFVLEHPASMRIFNDYYILAKNEIKKCINKQVGDKATKKALGLKFIKNAVSNSSMFQKLQPVSLYFKKFTSLPAVVITSGPSLDFYIEQLVHGQNNFFIIAVDSALPVLLKNRIKPDFVISIDPQPYIYEHFQECREIKGVPVLSLTVHPLIVKMLPGLLSLNSHPFSQLADEVFDNMIGSVDSLTGTVAGDAVRFCVELGFSAVGLLGFDFSFIDYSIYARGTAYQRRYAVYFQDRFNPVENRNLEYIRKSSKGYKVSGRFTRKSFVQYKERLEEYIASIDGCDLYNINNSGLPIDGTAVISLEEFMDKYSDTSIKKDDMLKEYSKESLYLDKKIFQSALEQIIESTIMNDLLDESLGKESRFNNIDRIKLLVKNILRKGSIQ